MNIADNLNTVIKFLIFFIEKSVLRRVNKLITKHIIPETNSAPVYTV